VAVSDDAHRTLKQAEHDAYLPKAKEIRGRLAINFTEKNAHHERNFPQTLTHTEARQCPLKDTQLRYVRETTVG
jgi:hypothetical protein